MPRSRDTVPCLARRPAPVPAHSGFTSPGTVMVSLSLQVVGKLLDWEIGASVTPLEEEDCSKSSPTQPALPSSSAAGSLPSGLRLA